MRGFGIGRGGRAGQGREYIEDLPREEEQCQQFGLFVGAIGSRVLLADVHQYPKSGRAILIIAVYFLSPGSMTDR